MATDLAAVARPLLTHAAINEYLDLGATGQLDPGGHPLGITAWINRWGTMADKAHLMELRGSLAEEEGQPAPARDERWCFCCRQFIAMLAVDVLTAYVGQELDWRAAS